MDDATRALRKRNEMVIDYLSSGDQGLRKEAQDTLNDYIRVKAREDGVLRKILPPFEVTAADLDPQYGIEAPVMLFEKEPDSASAFTVPFSAGVESREFEGEQFLVVFDTIRTFRKRKSKFLLMNYKQDIRNILTDLDTKEVLEHEDARFFATIDSLLGGAAGTTLSSAGGVALWQTVAGGLTPETWIDMMQIMPKASGRFEPSVVVMNMVRAQEITSWDADLMGPQNKEEVFRTGWTEVELFGKRVIVTIKRDIVGDNEVYMFADPNKIGKFCVLQDVTIYPDSEGEMIEWYCLESLGFTIANVTGVAKATITG